MSVELAVIEAAPNQLTQVHNGDTINDVQGTHIFVRGDEVVFLRAPGAATVDLEVNPNNPWGRTTAFSITFTAANEVVIIDLTRFPTEMIKRVGVSEAGAILFNASVAGVAIDVVRAAPYRG